MPIVLLAFAGAGCVEPYGGSNVQIDFSMAAQTAARVGATPLPNQPPANTHYVFYAADYHYATDANGQPVVDDNGDPVVDRVYLYDVKEFEIRTVIDQSSPCFIDLEDARFPGIHVTRYAAHFEADLAVKNGGTAIDPFDPNTNHDVAVDILTARARMAHLDALQGGLKAVVDYSPFRYADLHATGTTCDHDPDKYPAPQCDDDDSNALRLRLCEDAWSRPAAKGAYEGSDKIFTLPLSGTVHGMVEGMNPLNNGYVGGAGMFVDTDLAGIDAFLVNWDYNDPAADPLGANRSATGYHYLQGLPRHVARGVTNSHMVNLVDASISADLAVFANLDQDTVHF